MSNFVYATAAGKPFLINLDSISQIDLAPDAKGIYRVWDNQAEPGSYAMTLDEINFLLAQMGFPSVKAPEDIV
jgi:hypothetical protein